MKTHDLSPAEEQEFKSKLEQSKKELDSLRAECVVRNLSDPLVLIHEKRLLINQLDLILKFDLSVAWEQCQHPGTTSTSEEFQQKNAELKKALYAAMESFYEVTMSLKNLDINLKKEEEEKFQASLKKFDDALTVFEEKSMGYNTQAASFTETYATLKQQRKSIERVIRGAALSTSMGFFSTALQVLTIVGYSWIITLKEAAAFAGSIFYPIGATFTSLTKLFNLIATTSTLGRIKSEREQALDDMERAARLTEAEALLRTEKWLKLTSFVLNTLSVIAFAGALTSPIGWVLVAAATIVDWRDTGVNGVKKAQLEYEHANVDAEKATEGSPEYEKLQNIVKEKAEALDKAKTEEKWCRVNAVAMILFACAPIPVVGPVFLGLGFATFGIASARNIIVALKPRFARPSSKKEKAEEGTEMADLRVSHKQDKRFTSTAKAAILLSTPTKSPQAANASSYDQHSLDSQVITSAKGIFQGQVKTDPTKTEVTASPKKITRTPAAGGTPTK